MRLHAYSPRQRRVILWIALVAMVLMSAARTVRYRTCLSGCCEPTESTCCATAHGERDDCCQEGACCGCCELPGDDRGDDDEDCGDPDCCITVAFDVELSKSVDAGCELPLPDLAFERAVHTPFAALPRQVVRTRPFERGPPRPPRTVELRRTTVLLI